MSSFPNHPHNSVQSKSDFFAHTSPKFAFLFGVVLSAAVISIIVLIVIVSIAFKGGSIAYNGDSGARVAGVQANAGGGTGGGGNEPVDIKIEPITKGDHVRGDRDAKISIVEFSDLDCPFCQRFHETMKQVRETYSDDVNWVYRHFPLTSLHPAAHLKAVATECAADQKGDEGFWTYTDHLFNNQGKLLDADSLADAAQSLGFDKGKFANCLSSGKFDDKVTDHANQATAAGGRGTPYNVLVTPDGDTVPFSGAVPFEQIKQVIDSLL